MIVGHGPAGGRAANPRHQQRRAGRFRAPRRGPEVVRIVDPVQDDDEVIRPHRAERQIPVSELARRTDNINGQAEALFDLGRVLARAGRRERAEQALTEAIALFEQKGNVAMAERVQAQL